MHRVLCTIIGALTAAPAAADTSLDEILSCNYETRGGYETIKDVDSARFEGTMTMGAMEAPFTMEFKRPGRVRMEFEVQGMTAVQAYNGETGWSVMPFMGKTSPEEMPEDEIKNVKQMAEFDGPLVDWKDKGHELTYLGTEEVDGTQAHVIEVERNDGDRETHYLDTDHCLTFKQQATREIQGNEMRVATELGNYKQVGGIVIPHSMTQSMGEGQGAPQQTITIEASNLGVEIPEQRFEMPEKPAAVEGEEGAE